LLVSGGAMWLSCPVRTTALLVSVGAIWLSCPVTTTALLVSGFSGMSVRAKAVGAATAHVLSAATTVSDLTMEKARATGAAPRPCLRCRPDVESAHTDKFGAGECVNTPGPVAHEEAPS
jgi:hypothetical protein